MTLTFDLSPEAELRLKEEAARQGQEPSEFARSVLEERFIPRELEEELDRLRRLVEQNRVETARSLSRELVERWPEYRRVQHWARVLAPPTFIPTPDQPNRSFDKEYEWLRQHRHEYPGCWIAVYGDRLIAADPELARVHQLVREELGDEGAFIVFSGKKPSHRTGLVRWCSAGRGAWNGSAGRSIPRRRCSTSAPSDRRRPGSAAGTARRPPRRSRPSPGWTP